MRGLSLDEHHHRTPLNEADVIRELLRRNATFAAYRSPERDGIVQVQRDPVLRQARTGERSFVIAPFIGVARCIRPDIELSFGTEHASLEGIATHHDKPSIPPVPVRGLDRGGYRTAVERAIHSIRQGPLKKVVLARTIEIDMADIDIANLYSAATRSMPDAFVALMLSAEHGIWLGASPERLLVMQNVHAQVDALAGTMLAETAPIAAAWGAKEREEQELVVRSVLRTMRAHSMTDLETEGPDVVKAGRAAHLRTRITGRSTHADPIALAAALHPTPAVAGAPRTEALDLIHELEPNGRSLYAGYWGPMDAERAEFFVNIRCLHVVGTTGVLHVGAGITGGSDPDRECDEVELKARTWLDLIEAQRRAG